MVPLTVLTSISPSVPSAHSVRTRPLIDFRCVAGAHVSGTDTSTVPETLRIEMRPSPDAPTLIRPLTFFTSAASVSPTPMEPDTAATDAEPDLPTRTLPLVTTTSGLVEISAS